MFFEIVSISRSLHGTCQRVFIFSLNIICLRKLICIIKCIVIAFFFQWTYSDHNRTNINVIFYLQSTGLGVGAILGGFAADLLGRKHILFVSYALMMLAHCLIAACSDFTCFSIGRLATNIFAGKTRFYHFFAVV